MRAGQAGLLHKCFTDSSAQKGQKSVCGCPCLTAPFCQDCFQRATVGKSAWCLIGSGISGWKEKYFNLRSKPNLLSSSTAFKNSCQPNYPFWKKHSFPHAQLHRRVELGIGEICTKSQDGLMLEVREEEESGICGLLHGG